MSIDNAPVAGRRLPPVRPPHPPGKGLDRAALLDELSTLHEKFLADPAAFRRAAIANLQATLAAGRGEARRALEKGAREGPAPRL